ncbi:hypothetical protein SLS57_005481 [Botryosphaeria dothidea]
MGARPRTATSESGPALSPAKSRFSRLRYRRFREKVASNQQPPPSSSLPGGLEEAGFLGVPASGEHYDDDEEEDDDVVGRRRSFLRRPSTAGSTTSTASSASSSSRWSWTKRKGLKGSRSSVSLRERWRASIASSSSALSSSASISSTSSSSSGYSSSTVSSTWSSLESTPRASIASSRTSISSNEDIYQPPSNAEQKHRPQKRVRAYVCRHFVSVPIEEDEEEERNQQQTAISQPFPCHPSSATDNHITDPMADAFDIDSHIPIMLLPRPPFAEPTPPPTPPPTLPSAPNTCDGNAQSDVPTFTLTPASPIRESPPTSFPPTPPITKSTPVVIPTRPSIPQRRSSFVGNAEKGAPSHCPACAKLQECIQQMRKVAGIYGPRHSLTVAAAKGVRAARVAVANTAWETSCSAPYEGVETRTKSGRGVGKVVGFKEGAEFWGDFAEAGAEAAEAEADEEDRERQKSREMVITQRLWGPLGERGRKQRDFKRSAAESYVPGRWAPPRVGHEGWLDTSGRSMSYEEFWEGREQHHGGGKVRLMEGLLRKWVHVGGGAAAGKKKESEKEKLEREILSESRGIPGVGLDVD